MVVVIVVVVARTTASLSCASRAMEVDLEFTEPFYGIVYADVSRTSACSLQGEGLTKYHFELPLAGCGTLQVSFFIKHLRLSGRAADDGAG